MFEIKNKDVECKCIQLCAKLAFIDPKIVTEEFLNRQKEKNKQKEEETDFFLGGWEMTMHLIFQIY